MLINSRINRLGFRELDGEAQDFLFNKRPSEPNNISLFKIKNELEKFGISLPSQEVKCLDVPDHGLMGTAKEVLDRSLKDVQLLKDHLINNWTDYKFVSIQKDQILVKGGWTRYKLINKGGIRLVDSEYVDQVKYPDDEVIVFDTETLVKDGGYPVMATAISKDFLYIWLHPSLETNLRFYPMMIPMGNPKTIIGHNVGFDAAKIEEVYTLERDGKRFNFLDTMSFHVAVNGMTNKMVPMYAAQKIRNIGASSWASTTCGKGLVDAYCFHTGETVKEDKKSNRVIFEKGSILDVAKNLKNLILYNVKDVNLTGCLFSKLFPKYLFYNPEDFTLKGMIELGNSVLPVPKNWYDWLNHVNKVHTKLQLELNQKLTLMANELIERYKENPDFWKEDPWLNQLDWSFSDRGKYKGIPNWYKKQVISKMKSKGRFPVSPQTNLAPLLLKMDWNGNPIHKLSYSKKTYGWCYKTDRNDPQSFYLDGNYWAKVPHPKGGNNNCGNPLGKDYLRFLESGQLGSADESGREYIETAKALSFWSLQGDRVSEQIAINKGNYRIIKPMVVPHGTITRRASEKCWLVLPDPKSKVIGSETKSMIRAPEGKVFVGFDFDAQELRIGAAKADSYYGFNGSTAMSITQFVGSKSNHTDGHSQLAIEIFVKDILKKNDLNTIKTLGLLDGWNSLTDKEKFLKLIKFFRNEVAKPLNFQMLFFGGVRACSSSIKNAVPTWSDDFCKSKAEEALSLKRGKKVYKNNSYRYEGGTDSHAYNLMLDIAESGLSRTILGKSAISEPLQADNCGKDFMPNRANRPIQSAGVDILHVFLSLLDYLYKYYEIDGRFCIAIHDEIWTIVDKKHRIKAAWVLQLCHAMTWAIFYDAYGFDTMLFDGLFASEINIDYCIRKEVDKSTITPSHEYQVQKGKGYNINQLIKITNRLNLT